MDTPLYHVMLEGRRVGPYDRRTIVGMRIKKALSSDHELVASDGSRLTVADLVKLRPRDNSFQPNRSGSYSVVQATYSASVPDAGGAVPVFKGEVELRVQGDVLRIAGRMREGLGWKEGRVKLPLADIAHARVRGTQVDIALRTNDPPGLRQLTLELFTHDGAGDLAQRLPTAAPWPAGGIASAPESHARSLVWAAVIGTAVLVGLVLAFVLTRR